MIHRHLAATAMLLGICLSLPGCAVSRGQETVGAYIDDAAITTSVKARFFEDKNVAGSSISVETLNGTVLLSGFAKSASERESAERIARAVKGVKTIRNEIAVRP
jgi:hyperosmotically inducible protein